MRLPHGIKRKPMPRAFLPQLPPLPFSASGVLAVKKKNLLNTF
jgi:hypothetical protein